MTLRKLGILLGLVVAGCLVFGSLGRAEEDDGAKGKGKGQPAQPAARVISLDISKLPPDLAKALLKYSAAPAATATTAPSKGKAPAPAAKAPAPKGPPAFAAKGKAPAVQLPPGLAKKPADHPGRTHYIQHVLRKGTPAGPGKATSPVKPGKGKKGDDDD
jgi:hypothetical protein